MIWTKRVVVIENQVDVLCPDFTMVFRASVGANGDVFKKNSLYHMTFLSLEIRHHGIFALNPPIGSVLFIPDSSSDLRIRDL